VLIVWTGFLSSDFVSVPSLKPVFTFTPHKCSVLHLHIIQRINLLHILLLHVGNMKAVYKNCITRIRSRVSSGSIVSDYWLDDRAIGVRSPAGAKDFSSSLCVQTGSGAHPASYTMGTGGPFPGGISAAGA
jgi:hypothetical protein